MIYFFFSLQIIESEDSSDDSDTIQKINSKHNQSPSIQKNLEALLKTIGLNSSNMTSLESMAAQLAAFQRLQTPELNQMNPFYPSEIDFLLTFKLISFNSSVP